MKPAPPGARASDHRRAPVDRVTAVVLDPRDPAHLDSLLDALAEQTRHLDAVALLVDDADGEAAATARAHELARMGIAVHVHEIGTGPQAVSEALLELSAGRSGDGGGDATTDDTADGTDDNGDDRRNDGDDRDVGGTDQRPDSGASWWWLLTPSCRPQPAALAHLIEATRRTSGVGVVGPKLLDRDNPRTLVLMGHRLSRAGRPGESIDGLVDQGQFDQHSDILGIPVAGMFVRVDVVQTLGGFDPAFLDGVEGLDLSWRSHLAGHRVVLAPAARLEVDRHEVPQADQWRVRRRLRQLAIARGSLLAMPLRSLAIVVGCLAAALILLLLKRPGAAKGELADVTAALAPARGLGARWRFRGHTTVARRHLTSLFETPRRAWSSTTGVVQDALTPRQSTRSTGAAEPGPVSDEALSLESTGLRWWSWPLVCVVLATTLLAWVRWRELWAGLAPRSAGVSGGELSVTATDATGLWQTWAAGWGGAGLGSASPAEPWLLPMSGMTFLVELLPWVGAGAESAALTTTWLLAAAMPAAAVSGYLAARVVIGSRWARAAAGLVWAVLPPLTTAVDHGRLGPALVHVAAPLVVAGFAVAARRGREARRTAATFATVALLGILAWFVPGILLVSTVAGLLVLAGARGLGRMRGAVLAVLPWTLLGPWLAQLADDPRLLFSGAGVTTTSGGAEPWQAVLLHPEGAPSPAMWWTAPLVVLAALGAVRVGERGRRATLVLCAGLLGIAAALAAPMLDLGTAPEGLSDAGLTVLSWQGTYLSIAAAGILLAAAAAAAPASRRGHRGAWWRAGQTVLTSTAGVAAMALLVWTTVTGIGPAMTVADRGLPALVTESAHSGQAARALQLWPSSTAVSFRLDGAEPQTWVRDRVRELSPVTAPPELADPTDPGQEHLQATVTGILGYSAGAAVGTETNDEAGDDLHARLHGLAVAFVVLHAEADDPLIETIDAIPGLSRLAGTTQTQMWRVAGTGTDGQHQPSRVRVIDDAGEIVQVIPADGLHARVDGVHVPAGGTLIVSQGAGWSQHAQVRLDGAVLEADQSTGWAPEYHLATAGELQIGLELPWREWHLATAALALVVLFLALPIGGRTRGGSR